MDSPAFLFFPVAGQVALAKHAPPTVWRLLSRPKLIVNQLRPTQTRPTTPSQPLTRPRFYGLTEWCRDYAQELAGYDQQRVNLQQCHKFNAWFAEVKGYPELAAALRDVRRARPVARWQVMTLAVIVALIVWAALSPRLGRGVSPFFFSSYPFLFVLLYFMPERLYGTTVEMLEGKVLRVVDALDALLQRGELHFTEAAFFQAKANLEAARAELRQQIDLAHRRWR